MGFTKIKHFKEYLVRQTGMRCTWLLLLLQVDQLCPTYLGINKEQYSSLFCMKQSSFSEGKYELSAGSHTKSLCCKVSLLLIT